MGIPSRFTKPASGTQPAGGAAPETGAAQTLENANAVFVQVRMQSGLTVVYKAGYVEAMDAAGSLHLFETKGGARVAIIPPGVGIVEFKDPEEIAQPIQQVSNLIDLAFDKDAAPLRITFEEPPAKPGFLARLLGRQGKPPTPAPPAPNLPTVADADPRS